MARIYRVSWTQLLRLQRSFGPKAAVALPLVALAVAALPSGWMRDYLLCNLRLHAVFWGALLFLLGQAVIWARRPIEFARDLDVYQELRDLKLTVTYETFKSRCLLLERLVQRFSSKLPSGLSRTTYDLAKVRLDACRGLKETNAWRDTFPYLVISDRALRDYDRPQSRLCAVVLLGGGTALLLLPTALNAFTTALELLHTYAALWPR